MTDKEKAQTEWEEALRESIKMDEEISKQNHLKAGALDENQALFKPSSDWLKKRHEEIINKYNLK